MKYTPTKIMFKYYGKNVELLIERVMQVTDTKERETQVIHLARLMKMLYAQWNHETISNERVVEHMEALAKGKMDCDMEKIKADSALNVPMRESTNNRSNERRSYQNGKDRDRRGSNSRWKKT